MLLFQQIRHTDLIFRQLDITMDWYNRNSNMCAHSGKLNISIFLIRHLNIALINMIKFDQHPTDLKYKYSQHSDKSIFRQM